MDDQASSSSNPWVGYALPFMLPLLYHPSSRSFSAEIAEEDVEEDVSSFLMTGSSAPDSLQNQGYTSIPASLFPSFVKEGVNPLKLHANSLVSLESSDVAQRIKDSFL